MAARPTCSVAITFAGFPIPVRVYPAVASRKSDSFKMLDPVHKQPVKQILVDKDGTVVERAKTLKGVEVSKGSFVALGADALEMIENRGRSDVLEIERFAPVASIPFDLSLQSYRIVPNDAVPGAEQPVNILWNGLRESQHAAVIADLAATAASKPSTFVIHATDNGLAGNLIPFGSEIKTDVPAWAPHADERQASTFAAVVQAQYKTADFDLSVYTDSKAERRAAAIQLALSGKPITAEMKAEPAPAAAPDLMALMEASLAKVQTKEPVVA